MIPKIRFRYSEVFDRGYRKNIHTGKMLEEEGKEYPSERKIESYIKKVEKVWKKQEKEILQEIANITKFEWKEKEIICYIIGAGRSFSDPLTIKVFDDERDFIDTLVHELIHNFFGQNKEKYDRWKKYRAKKYKAENPATITHIVLHALHYKIYQKLFSEKRIKEEIRRIKERKMQDYLRSWEIVEQETPDAIIKKFHEVTK